jgi:hypothetical protein
VPGQRHRVGDLLGEVDARGVLAVGVRDEDHHAVAVDVADDRRRRRRPAAEDPADEQHRVLEVGVQPVEEVLPALGHQRRDGVVGDRLVGHGAPPAAAASCGRTTSSE